MPYSRSSEPLDASSFRNPAWLEVRTGLVWYLGGVFFQGLTLGLILLLVLMSAIEFNSQSVRRGPSVSSDHGFVTIVFIVCVLLLGVSMLMQMIGHSMCWMIPTETGCRALAIGSLVFTICALGFSFSCCTNPELVRSIGMVRAAQSQFPESRYLTSSEMSREDSSGHSAGLGFLFGLVGRVTFICFMSGMARFLGRPKLARGARGYLLFEVGMLAFVVFLYAALSQEQAAVAVLAGFMMLVVAISSVWQILLVINLRQAIEDARSQDLVEYAAERIERR
jgi:hypothetical protein